MITDEDVCTQLAPELGAILGQAGGLDVGVRREEVRRLRGQLQHRDVVSGGGGVVVGVLRGPIRGEHCGHVTRSPPITAHLAAGLNEEAVLQLSSEHELVYSERQAGLAPGLVRLAVGAMF